MTGYPDTRAAREKGVPHSLGNACFFYLLFPERA